MEEWISGFREQPDMKKRRLSLISLSVWVKLCGLMSAAGRRGEWLNRFLDFHLIRGRLLFWGCARNRISGFLHWGFNQFPGGMDPFKGTSCPNDTGIGTAFPVVILFWCIREKRDRRSVCVWKHSEEEQRMRHFGDCS